MEAAGDGSGAKDAAAMVASAAPMVRPWENPKPDPDNLVASAVSFTAFAEATCDRTLGALIKIEFRWFAENGQLTDQVDTGPVALWKDPLNPDVEPQPLESDQSSNIKKKKDQGKLASPGVEVSAASSPMPGPEEVPQVPVLRRFEKKSPNLQASCEFVRRLVNLSLVIRVHYPSQRPMSSRPQTSQTQAASDTGEQAEGTVTVLTKEFTLPLAPLLVRGSSPQVTEDICAALGCDGVEGLRIGARCDGPVLSEDLARHLNPMLITLEGVHKLPQDEHLGQMRDEVHAVLNAFGERRLAAAQTLDKRGGAKFRFHNVFFVGTWNWHELRDFVQTERLAIEVHDRGMPSMVAMRLSSPSKEALSSSSTDAAKAGARKGAAVETQQPESVADTVVEKAEPEPRNNTNLSGHFGVARFSLADIVTMRRPQPLAMRIAIEPAAVGSGASGNVPGKPSRRGAVASNNSATSEAAQQGELTTDTEEAPKTAPPIVAHEHAPGYIDNNSYVSVTVTLARSLHPAPIQPRGPLPEVLQASSPPQQESRAGSKQERAELDDQNSRADVIDQAAVERYERFQRIVLIMKYRQTSKLKSLLHLVKETNDPSSPNGSTFPSRQVSASAEEEKGAGEDVELKELLQQGDEQDILTGFVFLDRRTRIVVIEGLRNGVVWKKVLEVIGVGIERNTRKFRVIYNPRIGFRHRLYGDFVPNLKQVKLRVSSLEKLLQRAELYNATKSDQEAASALMTLAELKRVERLHHLKASTCFPTAAGICAVEAHHGDVVKDIELEGGCMARDEESGSERSRTTSTSYNRTRRSTSRAQSPSRSSSVSRRVESTHDKDDSDESDVSFDDLPVERGPRLTMKAPLNSDNAAYRKSISLRNSMRPVDFHERNREMLTARSAEHAANNTLGRKVPDQSFLEGLTVVHCYSGQALNSAELQKRAIRKKLEGREKEVLLTYSQDRNTGVFPLLEKEVDLSNVLRAPDPNYIETREPWQYPKPRDSSHYRKPDRDVSDARKDDLKDIWDEGALNSKLECRKGPMHNVFDAKSLGIGGAHVIEMRRPGLRNVEGAPPPSATRLEREIERGPLCPRIQKEEMKIAKFNNMGSMNTVDKYHRGILESAPVDKAFRFDKRAVPDFIAAKYGKGRNKTGNVEPAPVTFQLEEEFLEEPRNSKAPFHLAALCAKDVTHKAPLSAREKRTLESSKKPLSGTLAGWQKTGLTGTHLTFKKPGFCAHAVTALPLSAR